MLNIYFATGFADVQQIQVAGTLKDDLTGLIDEYVMGHKEEFIKYSYDELCDGTPEDEIFLEDFFMPINGGEFYINTVVHVEEI